VTFSIKYPLEWMTKGTTPNDTIRGLRSKKSSLTTSKYIFRKPRAPPTGAVLPPKSRHNYSRSRSIGRTVRFVYGSTTTVTRTPVNSSRAMTRRLSPHHRHLLPLPIPIPHRHRRRPHFPQRPLLPIRRASTSIRSRPRPLSPPHPAFLPAGATVCRVR
jgi:hypothetical protein